MAYWKDTWSFPGSKEYEYKFAGKYGARGEKREKKKKATPEQIKKQNQYNREKKMRRIIKANFNKGDLWTTLKYYKGTRKTPGEIIKDLRAFLTKMRAAYKKLGSAFKYIYRIEIGKQGGIHVHILVNRIRGHDTDIMIQDTWSHGHTFFENVYQAGGYTKLAEYIVKIPDESQAAQLSLFPDEEKKELLRYSRSRNMIIPEPERKCYGHWTMRRILNEGPKASPEYYIDKESIHTGVNPFTGMSYLQYTEYLIPVQGPPEEQEENQWINPSQ